MQDLISKAKELMQWADKYGLDEISVTDGDSRIQLSRNGTALTPAAASAVHAPPPKEANASVVSEDPPVEVPSVLETIVSPMVGTFYRAPNPDAAPYVKEGDSVSAGDTVCIVEAMKIMNQIQSPFDGTVKRVQVKNAETVMKDQVLFEIEPA